MAIANSECSVPLHDGLFELTLSLFQAEKLFPAHHLDTSPNLNAMHARCIHLPDRGLSEIIERCQVGGGATVKATANGRLQHTCLLLGRRGSTDGRRRK